MRGTAAWQDFLAKNPALGKEFSRTQGDYQRKLSRLRLELDAVPEVHGCIERLKSVGADRTKLIHVLAIAIAKPRWRDDLRSHNHKLRRLAGRIRNLADEVEQTYGRPETYPYLLGIAQQIVNDRDVGLVSDVRADDLAAEMRACADDLEAKARELTGLRPSPTSM
jgi:hypothetical protein